MNTETIILEVGVLLNKWQREEDSACTLYVENGKICVAAKGTRSPDGPRCLSFTRYDLKYGLLPARWSQIGTKLFYQLTKDISCQAHQKH